MRRSPWIALAFCAALGCVEKDPGPTRKEIDPAYIQKNLLPEAPAQMTNRVDGDIGGKIIYLGNDLDTDTVVPGTAVRVVHYWKVVTPPGDRWWVFAHLVGDAGHPNDWANIDETDMRYGHPPATWQAGEIIRDEQEFTVPEAWASRTATIRVGLFPKGGHTAKDRMAIVSGPADKESRLTVATFNVQKHKAARPPASKALYAINKVRGQITIDGRADEDDWKTAKPSPVFVSAEGSPALAGDTRARLVWDDENLYLFVEAQDTDVYSPFREHDDALWKADVIEIFIDADRNRRGYVELQVNPNNAHFDAFFPTTRAQESDKAWNANMTSQVMVRGTPANRADNDEGWDLELAIPLSAVKGTDETMTVRLPPQPGDKWRLNVVRIDLPKGSDAISVGSWNQITYQDFHALGRMLEVEFADEHGMTPRPAQPAAVQPGTARHGTAQPGTAQPGTAQPGTTKPDVQPATTKPDVQPGAAQPLTQPGAAQPEKQPGAQPKATLTPAPAKPQ